MERKAFSGLVEQINRDTGRAAGIELELWMWETDSKPGFHLKGPQGLIDEVLRIEDCDLFVGIFWNRIGTPTPDGMTGTEHEFSAAYKSWQRNRRPEIMFYFNEKASTLASKEALDQRGKVLDFRNSFPEEGLYWPYNGKAEFLKHANDHLRKFIQQQISMQATAKSGTTHGDGENDNAHKEQKFFSFIVGKDGAVQLPIDMLSQLGLAEGGRLEFTVANHRVINVLPVAAPFNPSAIELLSKRQNAIAENLKDSEFGRTLRKTGAP